MKTKFIYALLLAIILIPFGVMYVTDNTEKTDTAVEVYNTSISNADKAFAYMMVEADKEFNTELNDENFDSIMVNYDIRIDAAKRQYQTDLDEAVEAFKVAIK